MKPFVLRAMVAALLGVASSPALADPVTIESYYRIKWGSAEEFKQLYKRNHEPILKEMQKLGFIRALRIDTPFTHMAGDQRWDLRVTITYRDAPSAVDGGAGYDAAAEKVIARLYPDTAKLDADEARRFSLLEEHWDVIVAAEK